MLPSLPLEFNGAAGPLDHLMWNVAGEHATEANFEHDAEVFER